MDFMPLGGRVLVQRDLVEDKVTASGLVVPAAVQDRPQMATVISVAHAGRDEFENAQLSLLNEGDRVVLGKYSGAEIPGTEGLVLTIVPVSDILGIVRG